MFCSHCGCKVDDDTAVFCATCGKEFLRPGVEKPLYGRTIKSFVDFKNSKDGKSQKIGNTTSGGKGKSKKKDNKKEEDPEVIISIGLMMWDQNEEELKEKRGKRLALRVNRDANYKTLLEKATAKWRDFHSNLYEEGAEYTILLEDGQEAVFLPGSSKEFFTLARYKEEVMKDFKRITLFLCTSDDFSASRQTDEEESQGEVQIRQRRSSISAISEEGSEPHVKQNKNVMDNYPFTNEPGPSGLNNTTSSNNDERGSWFLYDELNRLYGDSPSPLSSECKKSDDLEKSSTLDNEVDVVKALEKKVIADGKNSLFIVIRRGASLNRAISLWHRATLKVNPVHVLRVKFIGEDGIDSGALASEFFATVIINIGKTFFPNGSPLYSTSAIQNGNFKAVGEIVAASLAQGGPPPCFLAPCVYHTLVSDEDLDFTNASKDLKKHLTESELKAVEQIKQDVVQNTDVILQHGYTGIINKANVESIEAAVIVSILSRRSLMLREFKRGMQLYGLADIVTKHPKAARGLFVLGQQEAVDGDYLVSLLKPEYSPEGSSRRSLEEAVMDNFQDFIMDLEDESMLGYNEALAWKTPDDVDDDDLQDADGDNKFYMPDMTPASMMGWLTGQQQRDLTKKLPIQVKFDHDCMGRNPKHRVCFPYVGACGREITFPVAHMSEAKEFIIFS